MHHVLLIDEILRSIFTHVGDTAHTKSAFALLATVCHAWKDPALDFLWEHLSSIDPLFALLPNVQCVSGIYTLTGDIPPASLAKFAAYASRVRNIQHRARGYATMPPAVLACLVAKLSTCEPALLLPALTSVRLSLSTPATATSVLPPTLYLSAQLRSVSVDIGFARRAAVGNDLAAYIAALARTAVHLNHLSLRGRIGLRALETVTTLRGLRSLALRVGGDITPHALAALGTFPELAHLAVHLDGLDADALRADLSSAPGFVALRTLDARGEPDVLAALFERFPATVPLSHVHLEADLKPRAAAQWTPVLALLAAKAGPALTDLTLDAHTAFCETPSPDLLAPSSLAFTLMVLAPLAGAVNLRIFALDACVPVDLNDADLAALARWWPRIERLALWSRPVDAFDYATYFAMQPRATPAGLSVLGECCPALRSLTVPMDIYTLPTALVAPTSAAGRSVLKSLTIGCAKKGSALDAAELATYLFHAFPGVERMEFDCGEEAEWTDVAEVYRELQSARLSSL